MALHATPQLLAFLGALTGGGASYLTLRMFFGPHAARAIAGVPVPFTPGLFPHVQPRLADELAQLVHESLLTPGDLHYLAKQLVTADKIEYAIEQVLFSLLAEFRNTTNLHRLARDVGGLASEAVGQTLRVVVKKAVSGDSQVFDIPALVDNAVDYLLEEFEITPKLSTYLADRILEGVLSPAALRTRLIEFLTPDAIEALSRAIKRYTSGGLGLVLYFVNLRDGMTKFRIFMEDDPERAEQMLADLLERAKVRQTVEREIQTFSLKQLPWATIDVLKQTISTYVQEYLQLHEETLVPQVLERLEIDQLIADAIIRLDPDRIPAPLLKRLRHEISGFIQRYLDRDLMVLIEELLRGLDIPAIIAEKVRIFPAPLLEEMIERLGRPRLVAMVLACSALGATIGALAGVFVIG